MTPLLDALHVVRTPEQVEFEFPLAGPGRRFLAWAIDLILLAVAFALIGVLLLVIDVTLPGLGGPLGILLVFLLNWGYFVVFELLWAGRSPGKRLLGLRVLQDTGVRIDPAAAVLRNLLRVIDHLPLLYGVGGLTMLLSPKRQRLGDLVAGTIVVLERRPRAPAALAPVSEGAPSLLSASTVAAIRSRTTPEERALLTSAALRREELGTSARLGVFAELAALCEERFGVVRPAHLSEEKVVLEVVRVLLQEGATTRAGAAPSRAGPLGRGR